MTTYNKELILSLLRRSDNANNPDVKGKIFEDLVVYLMKKLQGVKVEKRNVLDNAGAQEIDIVFRNKRQISPFDFLDPYILTECKNEAVPLSSAKCREFVAKLRNCGATSGILVTSKGIAGQKKGYKHANTVILDALTADKIKLIVIDRNEILKLNTTRDWVKLISDKYLQLTLRRPLD